MLLCKGLPTRSENYLEDSTGRLSCHIRFTDRDGQSTPPQSGESSYSL